MPIRELSELVRTGQVSPIELTETFLDRLMSAALEFGDRRRTISHDLLY